MRTAVKSRPGIPPWAGSSAERVRTYSSFPPPPGEEVVLSLEAQVVSCEVNGGALRASKGSPINGTGSAKRKLSDVADKDAEKTRLKSNELKSCENGGAGTEEERLEAKAALSRLLVAKQKELLVLQLQAKEKQLAQLRNQKSQRAAPPAKAAPPTPSGTPPTTPSRNVGSPQGVLPVPHAELQGPLKGAMQRQQEKLQAQKDRLAAALARRQQLSTEGSPALTAAANPCTPQPVRETGSVSPETSRNPDSGATDAGAADRVEVNASGVRRPAVVLTANGPGRPPNTSDRSASESREVLVIDSDTESPSRRPQASPDVSPLAVRSAETSTRPALRPRRAELIPQRVEVDHNRERIASSPRSRSRSLSLGGASDDSDVQRRWRAEEALWRQDMTLGRHSGAALVKNRN